MMSKHLSIKYGLALVFAFAVMRGESAAQTPTQQRRLPKPTQTSSRIVAVEKYTDELDDYAARNPQARRFFTNTAEDQTGSWQEVGGEAEVANKASAIVWMKDDKAVIALLTGKTPQTSRKVTYYFRSNGTLAKVHSELSISATNMQSSRDRSYDPKAFLVRDFSYCNDMVSGQQRACNDAETLEKTIPLYMRSTELPFHAQLKKP
ncbi:MAG TPA: hypothetical protein VF735_18570 [Pyrinomonadaceae bacterium]|jgi:hypothetical protein